MLKHINIEIFGSVQDVGFRYASSRLAVGLGLKGFVRNQPDGSLYLEVEGEEKNLQEFADWCKQGPSSAEIAKVEITEGQSQNFSSFNILH